MTGREALCEELERCHADGTMDERLPAEPVLDAEHRDAMAALIEHHGEAVAGHVFQAFFAYLLAHAGYRKVMINSIGVPDIVLSELRRVEASPRLVHLGVFDAAEVRRLAQYCREAGDSVLAERIMACIERSNASR